MTIAEPSRNVAYALIHLAVFALAVAVALTGCEHDIDEGADFFEPEDLRDNLDEQGIYDCSEHRETGYRNGNPFPIDVVRVDGRDVEVKTANAYIVMQQAAARSGVHLRIVSGFRTMAEQIYFWNCFQDCDCNNCNEAARPGTSNHQSGHALDLNTHDSGVLAWLNNHGAHYGWKRTVPSEVWHWEWWGGGPGGGPCTGAPEKFTFETLEGDFDGDGKTDLASVSPDARNTWRDGIQLELARPNADKFASTLWSADLQTRMKNGGENKDYRVMAGDLDGDGASDLVAVSPNAGGSWPDRVMVELARPNAPTPHFASFAWAADLPGRMKNGGASHAYAVRLGDFDGDGKDDLAAISKNAEGNWSDWIAMELSRGNGFTSKVWVAETPQRMRNGGKTSRYFTLAGDFDGDGAKDLATVSPDAAGHWDEWIAMELSTGAGFASTTWDALLPQRMRNGGKDADYRVFALDVNGDGMDDIVAVSPDAGGNWNTWMAVELSTGTGFTSTTWASALPGKMRSGGRNLEYQIRAGDFDGDGAQDLSAISPDAEGWGAFVQIELARPALEKFGSHAWTNSLPEAMRNGGKQARYQVRAGDLDGDGKCDLVAVSPDADGVWKTKAVVAVSTGTDLRGASWDARLPERMRNAD